VIAEPVPRVADDERLFVDDLGHTDDGIIGIRTRFGYMERPDVPAALRHVDPALLERPIDLGAASYFLNELQLTVGPAPTMAPWRKRLFIATSFIAADSAGFFGLPLDRTVVVGARVEV